MIQDLKALAKNLIFHLAEKSYQDAIFWSQVSKYTYKFYS